MSKCLVLGNSGSQAGTRNTTRLLGMIETYPLRWSGELRGPMHRPSYLDWRGQEAHSAIRM